MNACRDVVVGVTFGGKLSERDVRNQANLLDFDRYLSVVFSPAFWPESNPDPGASTP